MAICRIRYKSTVSGAPKRRLRDNLPPITCGALSCETEASLLDHTKDDHFELFFDPANEDDVWPQDFFIEVSADRLLERNEKGEKIADEVEESLRRLFKDTKFGFYVPTVSPKPDQEGLWRVITT